MFSSVATDFGSWTITKHENNKMVNSTGVLSHLFWIPAVVECALLINLIYVVRMTSDTRIERKDSCQIPINFSIKFVLSLGSKIFKLIWNVNETELRTLNLFCIALGSKNHQSARRFIVKTTVPLTGFP